MKTALKPWQITLLSIFTIMFAAIISIFCLKADPIDEEETPEELVDNWNLDIVFYDSSVDNGKTPLTEINWDASDNGYNAGDSRVITIQINYDNDNAITTYQPGELKITIPNIFYSNMWKENNAWQAQLATEITVGANDSIHTGYAWTVASSGENFIFTNTNIVEQNTNFEGSIQIVVKVIPKAELVDNGATQEPEIERNRDECTHNYNKEIQAILSYSKTNNNNKTENVSISTNILLFNYTRTYIHPWNKGSFSIEKITAKVDAPDGLPAGNYYWVKYVYKIKGYGGWSEYPRIGTKEYYITDEFPEECVVVDSQLNICQLENNIFKDSTFNSSGSFNREDYIFVGYPKEIYNEENNNLLITNHIDLYVQYETDTEANLAAQDDVSLNLADFDFTYPDKLYSISKSLNDYDGKFYSRFLLLPNYTHTCAYCGSGGHTSTCIKFRINSTAIYTGSPITVRHGDDLLYITDSNSNYRRLTEDEYFFDYIQLPDIKNRNNVKIPYNKYPIKLYVRYAGNTNYELFKDLSTESSGKEISFIGDKKVVAWYIEVEDSNESIIFSTSTTTNAYFYGTTGVHIKPLGNISTSGTIYNFAFTEVFFKDENGNLVLQNEPTLDNYATLITQDNIANYDLNTYGHYIQRATKSKDYTEYGATPLINEITTTKKMDTAIQNAEDEIFTSINTIDIKIGNDFRKTGSINENYLNHVVFPYTSDYHFITSLKAYDLLPKGMDLVDDKQTLLSQINVPNTSYYSYFYYKNGTRAFYSSQDFFNFIKEHATTKIIENWRGTGRTKIEWHIDFPNSPLIYINSSSVSIQLKYNTQVTYDNFLEFGNTYKNYIYVEQLYENIKSSTGATDNGSWDKDASDINENGNTSEKMAYNYATLTITSVVSTHQDVTTYVETDYNNFSTGIVDSSCNSEYKYKLRIRTGITDITNLTIYTSIEEAQPNRTRWYGEFLGVDTTYAENKGYTVKVWYSPNKTVRTLAEDNSWLEYTDSTNKNDVKSLAFQYLDSNGNAARLPANSLTYVLIKMKSPTDENIKTLARMDCWTQWNALDDYDRPVDFITGINSNVVKVALPNSVKTDDVPSISLNFIKEIAGSDEDFNNLLLNKADEQIFAIRLTSLTANNDGSYNQITGLLSSTQGLSITNIPIGTYLLEELGDNYFNFVEFSENNEEEIIINGVTFEQTNQGYIITVSEDLSETIEFNIKVTNEIENERFYEDKSSKENFFLKNKIEENPEI